MGSAKRITRKMNTCVIPLATLFILFPFGMVRSGENTLTSTPSQLFAQAKDDKNASGSESLSLQIEELRKEIEEFKKEVEEKSGVSLGGFFDMNATNYDNNPNAFSMGRFEFNIEKSAGEYFQVATALVFSEDENGPTAELAVGFIDFHFYGGTIAPRGKLFSQKGFHIQAGRFDIPFGNDWLYFPSTDRESITPPVTTDLALNGGLNDVGLRILGIHQALNYTMYMLRGVGEGNSYGGRMGLTPFHNPFTLSERDATAFELGGSIYYDLERKKDENGDIIKEERGWAVDVEIKLWMLNVRGEYVQRDNFAGTELFEEDETLLPGDVKDYHLTVSGWHVTGSITFEFIPNVPFSIFGRYDHFKRELKPYSVLGAPVDGVRGDISRAASGLNFNLFDAAVLKLEYLYYLSVSDEFPAAEDINRHNVYVQLVIKF